MRRLTTEEFKKRVKDSGSSVTLIGEYTSMKTKTVFQCENGHTFTTIAGVVAGGGGCSLCHIKHRLTIDEINEWLKNDGRGITLEEDTYINTYTPVSFRCHCGNSWKSTFSNINQGRGCPACAKSGFNPDKPAWEYGFIRDGYLKIGITNDLEQRLSSHRRHGKFDLVHVRHQQLGRLALEWERRIKQTHGGRFVTKEQCPDGYTETFPIHLLEEIKQ
jgi:hypothetical protein